MPSSTSSSESSTSSSVLPLDRAPSGPGTKTWVLVVLLFLCFFLSIESFWRHQGFQAEMVDDLNLWAYQRSQIYDDDGQSVVLVGGSRILQGFSTDVFRKRYPDFRITQLAAVGKIGFAPLEDLAKDNDFRGIVICSAMPDHFWQNAARSMANYVKHYRSRPIDFLLNHQIRTSIQQRLVSVQGRLGLKSLWRNWMKTGAIPTPSIQHAVAADRSRFVDFRGIDLSAKRATFLKRMKGTGPGPNPKYWWKRVQEIEPLITKIQDRGGRVIFVRYPLSGDAKLAQAKRYPRDQFWNIFASKSEAVTIHSDDYKSLSSFECPDWSHLDARDVPAFTSALLDVISDNGVLESASGNP